MVRYNVSLHPELASLRLGTVRLSYSRHARERALQRGLPTPFLWSFPVGAVVEVEMEGQKVVKVVARVRLDAGRDWVGVLVPVGDGKWRVVTVWVNCSDDNHASLRMERFSQQAA